MTDLRQAACLLLTLLALAGCSPAVPPDTFPGQPVTERNRLFKQMLRSFEPIGLMVRGKAPYDAQAAIGHADELKRLSRLPWQHFPPGSDYPPTKAKKVIWDKPQEFTQARDEFEKAADQLAAAAQTKDKDAMHTAYDAVHQVCSSCHKAFRH